MTSRHRAAGPPARRGNTGHVAWTLHGGGPGVPVLALHAFADSGECMVAVVDHLAGTRPVLTLDARGHGESGLPDAPFTMAALAADAAAAVRAALPGWAVVVVGHAMGALVATELAVTEPDLVAGLVLEEPPWRLGEVTPRGMPAGIAEALMTLAGVPTEALDGWSRSQRPGWPEDEHGPWALSKSQVSQRLGTLDHDWRGRDWPAAAASVAARGVEVTVVTGRIGAPGRVGGGSAVAGADLARLAGSGAMHAEVEQAGHEVRREARATYLRVLDEAMARVEA